MARQAVKATVARLWGPIARIEAAFDRLKGRSSRRGAAEATVHPYMGYGTAARVYLMARVLRGPASELPSPARIGPAEDEALAGDRRRLEALMAQSRRQTLARMWQRFETDEVPSAVVEVPGLAKVVTDIEGYAQFDLPPGAGTPDGNDPRWRQLRLRLKESERPEAGADAYVLVPGADARFGIISDIDDTIVRTNATSLRKMIPLVLTKNASGRKPFPGVAAFYKALERGGLVKGGTLNPVFYVSSSPWNLYDLIVDYMALQSIPLGPIFLRDFGLTKHGPIGEGHSLHKGRAIRRLFDAYPHLSFVLIGDSGEHDPAIYADVAQEYPNRVRAVYLRAVTEASARKAEPSVGRLHALDVPVVLAPDTLALAEHAAALGLIPRGGVEAVRKASARDA